CLYEFLDHPYLHSFPTRRSSDLVFFTDPDGREIEPVDNKSGRRVQREIRKTFREQGYNNVAKLFKYNKETGKFNNISQGAFDKRSEEHTSELQSRENLVCRLLLE